MSGTEAIRAKLGEAGLRVWLLGQVLRHLPDDPNADGALSELRKAYWYLSKLALPPKAEPPATPPPAAPAKPTVTHTGLCGEVTEVVNPAVWSLIVESTTPGHFPQE